MSRKSTICKIRYSLSVIALALLFSFSWLIQTAYAESGREIGTIPWLLSASGAKCALYEECSLGDAAADAILRSAACDVAIVNGGDLRANLLPGSVTQNELEESFIAGRTLAVAEVTPRMLVQILENAVSHAVLSGRSIDAAASSHGAFPQIAGFRFTYDPGAAPGQRIVNLKIGSTLLGLDDDATVLKLAATVHMFTGGYDFPPMETYQPLDVTLTEAMAAYVAEGLDDYSRPSNRITAVGISGNSLPIFYLALMCGVIVAITALFGLTTKKRKSILLIMRDGFQSLEDAESEIVDSGILNQKKESTEHTDTEDKEKSS